MRRVQDKRTPILFGNLTLSPPTVELLIPVGQYVPYEGQAIIIEISHTSPPVPPGVPLPVRTCSEQLTRWQAPQ